MLSHNLQNLSDIITLSIALLLLAQSHTGDVIDCFSSLVMTSPLDLTSLSLEGLLDNKGATSSPTNGEVSPNLVASDTSENKWLVLTHDKPPTKKSPLANPVTQSSQTNSPGYTSPAQGSGTEENGIPKTNLTPAVKASDKVGVTKKDLALGLASLYDDVEKGLHTPLRSDPETVSANKDATNCNHDMAAADSSALAMDYSSDPEETEDPNHPNRILSEWIGTSQFYVNHSIDLQMNVS
jgi:hypothetical protein